MKYLLGFIFSILWCSQVWATEQIPDKIIYNGKEYELNNSPLEHYFAKYPKKHPSHNREVVYLSTALRREYVATFEIKDNTLWVKDIQIMSNQYGKWESVIHKVFPNKKDRKLTWYSSTLTIPYGKRINYVHYQSTYENYILLEIKKGKLVKSKKLNAKQYLQLAEEYLKI